jgi:uncharacterized membrane protein HdeD (DUF308 family)
VAITESATMAAINPLRYSWVFLFTGVLLIAAGILAFYDPLLTGRALGIAFGVLIIILGISHMLFAFVNRHLPHWLWHVVTGFLDLVIGAFLLPYPDIAIVVLPFLLGFWFLVRGISLVFYAFALKRFAAIGWGWLFAGGIFIAVFALFVLWFPAAGFRTIVAWTGAGLIITGIANILLAMRLKERRRDHEQTIII